MNDYLVQIEKTGVVPVIGIETGDNVIAMCKAIRKGGISVLEVNFRTSAAIQGIKKISDKIPDMLIGAGNVLSVAQADAAYSRGAKFISTPGFNKDVVKYCKKRNIPIIPGCCNPTDIETALQYKLDVVKFFPAESYGGIKTLKAIAAPYRMIKFIPTGGINLDNLKDYLSEKQVIACAGSWMAGPDLINKGDFKKIEQLTRETVTKILGLEISDIIVYNSKGEDKTQPTDFLSVLQMVSGFMIKSDVISDDIPNDCETTGKIVMASKSMHRVVDWLSRTNCAFSYIDEGILIDDKLCNFKILIKQKQ